MLLINKKGILTALGAVFIVSLIVSSVTAVPQQNAEILNQQIDKKEKMDQFTSFIQKSQESETSTLLILDFLLNIADQLLLEIRNQPDSFEITEEIVYKALPNTDVIITEEDISIHTISSLEKLQDTINELDDSNEQKMDVSYLKTLIALLISFIKEKLLGGETTSDDDSTNDWISTLKEILSALASILAFLLKGLLQGISLLIGGLLRIIGAILTIVVLILAGLQTVLTTSGFLLVFMGFISKIGIKIFSVIAAPVFALLAAQFTVSLGTLLGGLSMALHAILAFILIFAIPILLIAGVFLLVSGNSEEDGDNLLNFIKLNWDGPLYMFLSIILNIAQT